MKTFDQIAELISHYKSDGMRSGRVVLVLASHNNIAGYAYLAGEIGKRGHMAIFITLEGWKITELERAMLDNVHYFALDPEILPGLEGVDVFITNEYLLHCSPVEAVTVAIFHSLREAPPKYMDIFNLMNNCPSVMKYGDYLTIGRVETRSPLEDMVDYRASFSLLPEDTEKVRTRDLSIITAGYPKVDFMEHIIRTQGLERDHIVYAPTNINLPYGQMKEHGKAIVEGLLKHTPVRYKVVIRPYHTQENILIAKQIVEQIGNTQRLILDTTRDGTYYLARAEFVVTDRSSISLSFSLSMYRASISVLMDDSGGDNRNEAQEIELGFRVARINQLQSAVKSVIDGPDYWHKKIEEQRSQYLYNPGRASAYLAEHIETIAQRRHHPEWFTVERLAILFDPVCDDLKKKGDLDQNLRRFKGHPILVFASAPDAVVNKVLRELNTETAVLVKSGRLIHTEAENIRRIEYEEDGISPELARNTDLMDNIRADNPELVIIVLNSENYNSYVDVFRFAEMLKPKAMWLRDVKGRYLKSPSPTADTALSNSLIGSNG